MFKDHFPEKTNSHKPQPTGIWWIFSLLWGDVAGALLTPCDRCHHKETALRNTLLSFPCLFQLQPAMLVVGPQGMQGKEEGNCKGPFPGVTGLALNTTLRRRVQHRQLWPSQIKAALIYQGELCCCSTRWGQCDPGMKGEELSKKAKPSPVRAHTARTG